MSRVFTDYNIAFSEGSEGSERDIFEISDRSRDEGEHKKDRDRAEARERNKRVRTKVEIRS